MILQPLTPGSTHGRYIIGGHELTSGDLIEFADADEIVPGRIEHDGMRYIVMAGDRRFPLAELTPGTRPNAQQAHSAPLKALAEPLHPQSLKRGAVA